LRQSFCVVVAFRVEASRSRRRVALEAFQKMKVISKHPMLVGVVLLMIACWALGPTRVGGAIGLGLREAVIGLVHFSEGFLRGVF